MSPMEKHMIDNDAPRPRWRGHGLVPALVLIAIGVFFLLRNLGVRIPWPEDWWAWAILVAAVVPLARALHGFRTRGGLDAWVARDLLNAALLVVIAVLFLMHLAWTVWWPLFVIYGGLYLLARQLGR